MRRSLFLSVVCALVATLLTPAAAYARTATNESARITARVNADGSMEVFETRTVRYEGEYHGFFWDLARKKTALGSSGVTIEEAGEVVDGSLVPYRLAPRVQDPVPGTFDVSDATSGGLPATHVDLHFQKSDETPTLYVRYLMTGAVARWADTSELYWQFVGTGWDSTTSDVACCVYLPAPEGAEVTPGDNVRAWLHHAPLTGTVTLGEGVVPSGEAMAPGDAGTVWFEVPAVQPGDYAETRILFPPEWLGEAPKKDKPRLARVLEDEGRWARSANALRARRQSAAESSYADADETSTFALKAAAVFALFLGCVLPLLGRLKKARPAVQATFREQYLRDVPTNDHPTVLAGLVDSIASSKAFTATIMRLTDLHVISLSKVRTTKKRRFSGTTVEDDYLMTLDRTRAKLAGDPIDAAAIAFLFDYVATRARRLYGDDDGNVRAADTLRLSDVERVARYDTQLYLERYAAWDHAVKDRMKSRKLLVEREQGALVSMMPVVCIVFAIALVFDVSAMAQSGCDWWPAYASVIFVALIGLFILYTAVLSRDLLSLTQEGAELAAQVQALKRWLLDFTRLKEAVPEDVVLWNRLLVMATALGISRKVIRQLHVVLPDLLSSTEMHNASMWFDEDAGTSLAETFSQGFAAARSAATPSDSSSSSESGSGGGASGGGGGGAGGGGGGSY